MRQLASRQPRQARPRPARAGAKSRALGKKKSLAKKLDLPSNLLIRMHDLMVLSRVLEERLIKIYKSGESFFWIGGPGEEAFGVALGLLVNKGQGPAHDYLHLHYRCTPTLVAMGMPMVDSIRLMMNRKTDPNTGGRNFSNHYCIPKWNVMPVTSPIEVQYSLAIGTAHVQARKSSNGITIVSGGDAGSAEGDFASSLIWSSRPKRELPMLITVQNNKWGISTDYASQHSEVHIADRGKAFGIKTAVIDGNDPIESYVILSELMAYIRKTRKPVLVEAQVSRLYGHSSASGANLVPERDCVREFEAKLIESGVLTESKAQGLWQSYEAEARRLQELVRDEPEPTADSVWDYVYANNENADWRKF